MTSAVTVVDYGIGNLKSVCRAFAAAGGNVELTSDAARLGRAERLVLPGVGAFGDCVNALRSRGFLEPLRRFFETGRPFLGICVGMQMMMEWGEEFGRHEGLGLIRGAVRRIPAPAPGGTRYKIPHIGWSELRRAPATDWSGTILAGTPERETAYFVHSFRAEPADKANEVAVCEYYGHSIAAVIRSGPHQGCQFHPEKSGAAGLAMIDRFLSQ